jgi:hypothetical protein
LGDGTHALKIAPSYPLILCRLELAVQLPGLHRQP